jgi:hypothetical protein
LVDKRVAGGLTVLESIWGVYLFWVTQAYGLCTPSGLSFCVQFPSLLSQALLALVVLLLVDGLLGAWGARFAFYGGALLSVVFLLVSGYSAWLWGAEIGGLVSWIGVGLSVLGIVANVLAIRGKNLISEQANPMNLPVFG